MSIQRYDIEEHQEEYLAASMEESPDGDYVLFTDHAAEVERLTAERDALDMALDQANADGEERRKEAVCWRDAFVKAGAERDAAVAAKEAAVEALVSIENECIFMGMPFMAEKVRAALAKIEGGRNATR